MSNHTLKNLKLKKVEWETSDGVIIGLRFTLNDGSASNIVGSKPYLSHSADFPDDRETRAVMINRSNKYVYSILFLDAMDENILEINSKGRGKWSLYRLL